MSGLVLLALLVGVGLFGLGVVCGLWVAWRCELRELKRWRDVPVQLRERAFFSAVSTNAQIERMGKALDKDKR